MVSSLGACSYSLACAIEGRGAGGSISTRATVCVDPGLRLVAALPYAAESSAWVVLHTRARNAMWAALRGSPPRVRLATAGGFVDMRVHHVTKTGCASRQPPRKPF